MRPLERIVQTVGKAYSLADRSVSDLVYGRSS